MPCYTDRRVVCIILVLKSTGSVLYWNVYTLRTDMYAFLVYRKLRWRFLLVAQLVSSRLPNTAVIIPRCSCWNDEKVWYRVESTHVAHSGWTPWHFWLAAWNVARGKRGCSHVYVVKMQWGTLHCKLTRHHVSSKPVSSIPFRATFYLYAIIVLPIFWYSAPVLKLQISYLSSSYMILQGFKIKIYKLSIIFNSSSV